MLSRIDVIPADRFLAAAALGLPFPLALVFPDVAEVVALGDGDHHGHGCPFFPRSTGAELTMIIQ